MSQHPVTGFEIDQGFQSLKSREVSDSMRPDEMQFQSTVLKYPNTGGWNVQSAAEVSPDGRAYLTETVATTDGVENTDGGQAEYRGSNEQRSSGLYQGDDKNFVKKSMESSKTNLQEKFVSGDANSDHLEVRTSSSTQSSSSKVVQSSSTVEYDNEYAPHNQQLLKNTYQDATPYGKQYFPDDHYLEKVQQQEYYNKQRGSQSLNSEEVQTKTIQCNEKLENRNTMQNVETHQTVENQKRFVDMDKASPEYQKHVQYLMSQPGEIISNTVEYLKPNVKMITTVKRLPDGTIVRNKRYETEEASSSRPVRENLQAVSSTQRVHNQQINDQKTKSARTMEDHLQSNQRRHSRDDYIVQDTHSDETTNVKISSTKKSNETYATEFTSKVIQEYDEDGYVQTPNSSPQHLHNKTQSPRNNYTPYDQNKPEVSTGPSQKYSSAPQSYDSNKVKSKEDMPSTRVYERPILTPDEGEILVVTSEKRQNVKKESSSQHMTQTQMVADDIINSEQYPKLRDSTPKKILDEFSPVKSPSPKNYAIEPNVPSDNDRRGTPRERTPNNLIHVIENDERTAVHKTIDDRRTLNEEHMLISENNKIRTPEKSVGHYQPSVNQRNAPDFPTKDSSPYMEPIAPTKYPGDNVLEPSNRKATPDFTTQGFPSQVKPPASNKKETPDFTTHGFPSQVNPTIPPKHLGNTFVETLNEKNVPDFSTQGFPSQVKVTSPNNRPDKTYEESLQTQNIPYGSKTLPGTYKKPSDKQTVPDFSSHGFPSQAEPKTSLKYPDNTYAEPFVRKPDTYSKYPGRVLEPSKGKNHEFPSQETSLPSTQRPLTHSEEPGSYKNQEMPSGTTLVSYPSTYNEPLERDNTHPKSAQGYPSQTKPSTSIKKPVSGVVEVTQKTIKKEREVDAAHRAFASSLRSSSPMESRRDNYIDTQRHTPRSSISSNRTFKRDMRESSHDSSAPSETSRTSTNTVTKRIPSKTLQTKQTVPTTKKNVNSYEANRKSTKSPQTTRTPLGGTPLREPFKSEEPSNLPASGRKDFTNSKNKIPSDDTYQTRSHNQPLVESPQSMRKNERRTVSNETSITTNIDIEHDQASIILPDKSSPEVLEDGEVVDAFWRKPKKNNEKPQDNQVSETTVKLIDSTSKDTRRMSEEFKKPKTSLTGIKGVTNAHPHRINIQKEPSFKEPSPSHIVGPYNVVDDSCLSERPQLKNKASIPVTSKTNPSVISERKKLPIISTTENIYGREYIEESNYDNKVSGKKKDAYTYKQPVTTKDTKTFGKTHPVDKKTSPTKTLPHNLPSDKPNKQHKPEEPKKSPTREQPRKTSNAIHPLKESSTSKSPTCKAPSPVSKVNFEKNTSTFVSSTRKSDIEKLDAQYEHQPMKSPKSPTNKFPEPQNNMATTSIFSTTTYKYETQQPEEHPEYQPMKSQKSPTRVCESPKPEDNFQRNVSTFGATTNISDTRQPEKYTEFEPIKSRKSPAHKPETTESKLNFGTSNYSTISHKPNAEQFKTKPDMQTRKTSKSPKHKSESPEPKVDFGTTVSTFTTTVCKSNKQEYEELPVFQPIKSGKSPFAKPESSETTPNFGKAVSPLTTTGVKYPEPQHELPMNSVHSPTYKSKSPEPAVKFGTSITTITRKYDVQQFDEFEEEPKFQPTKLHKSPTREPKTPEPKPNFRKAASPFITNDVEHPEAQREQPMNSPKTPTYKSKSPEPTVKFETSMSTITSRSRKSDVQHYEEFNDVPELQPTKSHKSPTRDVKTTEPKPNFGKASSPFTTTDVRHPEDRREQPMNSPKSPTYKSKSPEPTVKFGTSMSTITSTNRKSDVQHYKEFDEEPELQPTKSHKSPTREVQTTEPKPNFGKASSPFTTTDVRQPEDQREQPMNSPKSPTYKSKSPEPTVKFETSMSTITSRSRKSDVQHYEEFNDVPELQPTKSHKSPTRDVKTIEPNTNFEKAASPFTTTDVKHPETQHKVPTNLHKSPTHKSKSPKSTVQFGTTISTVTTTSRQSDVQQYEEFEEAPEFQPTKSQKSPTSERKTSKPKYNLGKPLSSFTTTDVEQPEAQRFEMPRKSPARKSESPERIINFGKSTGSIMTSTTHNLEECPEFQPRDSQKTSNRNPEESERQLGFGKSTSTFTEHKDEEPKHETWAELKPTKSRKSPSHIYETPQPEVNFGTNSSPRTISTDKPGTIKPEEPHEFEPSKLRQSPTRNSKTVESKPTLEKTTSMSTPTMHKFDKEQPVEDQRTKFPKPSTRNFEHTDIQCLPTRDSPILISELSESTIHSESTDTERFVPEREVPKGKPSFQDSTYRKSPTSAISRDTVSQKVDLFNKSDVSKKTSKTPITSKESNKSQFTNRNVDYQTSITTVTKNEEQSTLKKFSDKEYETLETDEDYSKPTERVPFETYNSQKLQPEKGPTKGYNTDNYKSRSGSRNINTEFIKSEREKSTEPELFDGACVSKTPETTSPTLTNYRKKGVSSRETFEERCRQILGMEDYGSTPGTFKCQLKPEVEHLGSEREDYTDDTKRINVINTEKTDSQKPYNAPPENLVESTNRNAYDESYNETRTYTINDKRSYDHQRAYMDTSPKIKPNDKIKGVPHIPTDEDTLIDDETFPDIDQASRKQVNITLKLEQAQSIKDYDNINEYSQLKKTPTKSEKPKQQSQSPQVFTTSKNITSSRASRKSPMTSTVSKPKSKSPLDKSPNLPHQNVKYGSSSETSPNRISDRRRSSAISVNTEIIIDHVSPQHEDIKKSPSPTAKPKRKSISVERKDSAPVPRVTRTMKDAKVSRSISENIIKIKSKPKHGTNVPSERRPKKCFATKTINLAVKDGTGMENVIIDIQHAKSSREVSPNKVVPTPVPADLDVGHLRYPDLVQEPEDEPQRKPIEMNIPIFEEETNEFVGCHISEIYNENSTFTQENVYTIENEKSSISDIRTTDDECLLSVQEKVSKFTKSADEVAQPKSSSPFNREYDINTKIPEDDECLLPINEKVNRFQKNVTDIDRIQQDTTTSKINVPTKLRPSAPQKSPELVRSISKQMSTPQTEIKFDENDSITKIPQFDDSDNENETTPHTSNHTNVLEARRQKEILTRPSIFSKHNQSSTTILKQNQKQKHSTISNKYKDTSKPVETKYITRNTEVENVQIDNSALKFPLSSTDGAPTNLENTFDNNNIQFSIISQENQHFVEHSKALDQPITKHNKEIEKEPITSIHSPIKKVREGTMINKTHGRSFSSDDEVKNISAKTKATPHTSTKVVTARRNIFEKNVHTDKPNKLESTTPLLTSRRPSYMDHTKCSLEHIRRDSLEINKSNYSRKLSREDEGQNDRITSVKFDIPQRIPKEEAINLEDEINIEDVYDIEILEQMLQTVTSYELRRRIRAQIRRIKKETIPLRTEIDSSLKKRPKNNEYEHVHSHETNEIVLTTSDTEYNAMPNYGQAKTKPKPSSISPERGYNRYSKTSDIDKHPKDFPKLQSKQNTAPKKPLKSTTGKTHQTTVKPTETKDNDNIKGGEEFDERTTFHRNSVDRKTFTRETNVIKKQYENISKRSSMDLKSYNSRLDNRSPSPDVLSQTMTTSDFEIRTKSPETRRISVEHNFTQDLKNQRHDSTIKDRSTSPKSKPYSQVDSNIFESQTTKQISRDSATQVKRDQPSNSEQSIHTRIVDNKRTVDDRSSLKLEQKQKRPTETAPIWANRNNVLRSSTTRKSSNVDTQTKEMKFSTIHKDVKHVNKTSTIDQDSVVSSYGIGPTDENGVPLFGIKALRKKPTTSNVAEDITGCVIEEKYYSDNTSKPIVQRKETYYSTNPDQLKEIRGKDKVKQLIDKDTGLYIISKTDQEALEEIMESSITDTRHDDDDDTYLIDAGIKQENIINKSSWRVIDSPDCYDVDKSNKTYVESYSDAEEESFENYHSIAKNEISKARDVYSTSTRTFTNLSSSAEKQISGVSDVLQLMRNADNVIEEGDTDETQEARALLNKFIGASVIMNGVEAALPNEFSHGTSSIHSNKNQQEVKITRKTKTKSGNSSSIVTRTTTCDLQDIWDENILKQLLEQAKTYEERRKIRGRLRELMAEREDDKQQQEVATTTEKIEGRSKDGTIMTTTTKVTTRSVTGSSSNKPVSAFTKFKQLDAKNSQQQQHTKLPKTSPSQSCASTSTTASTSASTTTSSTAFGSSSLIRFVDPALNIRAATVKEQILQWCQSKTSEYENIKITNFSTSWSDGLAFCALIHHFLPDAFDYHELTAENRRKNFEIAFTVADEKAGIAPLLDVEDMVVMKCPDWKCVFVYVQSIYRRFRNCQ